VLDHHEAAPAGERAASRDEAWRREQRHVRRLALDRALARDDSVVRGPDAMIGPHVHAVRHHLVPNLAVEHERVPGRRQRQAAARMPDAPESIGDLQPRFDAQRDPARGPWLDGDHQITATGIARPEGPRLGGIGVERDAPGLDLDAIDEHARDVEAAEIDLAWIDPARAALFHGGRGHSHPVAVEPEPDLSLPLADHDLDDDDLAHRATRHVECRVHVVTLGARGSRGRRHHHRDHGQHDRDGPGRRERDPVACHDDALGPVLDVDLTIPIVILATAAVIVIGIRMWASVAERRMAERTAALIRDLRLDARSEGDADIAEASTRSPDEASKA
jgi:hypothetical protein